MPARAAHPWLGEWDYAHRGLHGAGRAENSRASTEAALAERLGIECDVQASRDGAAIVFHDWTLDRLTDQVGAVRDLTARELEQIALREGGHLWRLGTMLRLVKGRVPLLIEVKSRRGTPRLALCRSVARSLARYRGKAAVMSFDPEVVRWFAKAAPLRPRGLVTGRGEHRASGGARGYGTARALAIRRARPDFIACDVRDLPDSFIARQRQKGMTIMSWTVRSAEQRARAQRCCDALIAEGAGVQ